MPQEDDEEAQFRSMWTELLQREEMLRNKLSSSAEAPRAARRLASREWWKTVEELLRQYSRALAFEHKRGWVDKHPVQLLWTLGKVSGSLAVGTVPEPISDVASQGKPAAGPTERMHIGWATAYLVLAKRGLIADRTPIATIAEAYGARRQTAQQWVRRKMPDDVTSALNSPEAVEFKMRDSAVVYRRAGRSSVAIEARDAKRKAKVPT